MGMFDYVNFVMQCPTCDAGVSGFQSKDLSCDMVTVEPDEVNRFYADCDKCGTWLEFSRPRVMQKARATPLTQADVMEVGFELSVRPSLRDNAKAK